MVRASVLLTLVPLLLVVAYSRRVTVDVNSDTGDAGECDRHVAEPDSDEDLQDYFDGLREDYGILDSQSGFIGEGSQVDPAKCTKKDVCLLMRQLDMDFYQRARQGLLQDSDYDTPPTRSWVASGDCSGQPKKRGFKMVPVTDEAECRSEARKAGVVFRGVSEKRQIASGCVLRNINGRKWAFLNTATSTAQAGTEYLETGKMERKVVRTKVLCIMDRSLEEAGAAYYSPYKLKPSMLGREAHSTSCSFGMYAFLAKLRETMSPCAKILTYQTHSKFHDAGHALEVAAAFESRGHMEYAETVRTYVESIRQKYVLMDVIANQWCPGVWTAAMASNEGTCAASRVMSWTAQGQALAGKEISQGRAGAKTNRPGGRMGAAGGNWSKVGNQALLDDIDAMLASLENEDTAARDLLEHKDDDSAPPGRSDSRGKPIKIALTEAACTAFPDEDLQTLLDGRPQAPPDFFRDAHIKED